MVKICNDNLSMNFTKCSRDSVILVKQNPAIFWCILCFKLEDSLKHMHVISLS